MTARFADLVARAMCVIYSLALLGVVAALVCLHEGRNAELAERTAFLFLGAMVAAGATLCLVDGFKARIDG